MADIEVVIKIPEEDYERLKEYEKAPFNSLTSRVYEAIANGTPLPSEYKVYHSGSDYWWRGVRCTLDAIEGVKE